MFGELEADPDSGFLGYTPTFLGLRKGAAMQYWRSLEDLQRFATDPNGPHVPAWKWYNETADPDEGLGFWAELYVVDDDSFETFFRNAPPIEGREVREDDPDARTRAAARALPRWEHPERGFRSRTRRELGPVPFRFRSRRGATWYARLAIPSNPSEPDRSTSRGRSPRLAHRFQ